MHMIVIGEIKVWFFIGLFLGVLVGYIFRNQLKSLFKSLSERGE